MQKIKQEFTIHGEVAKTLVITIDYANSQRISNLAVLFEGKIVGYFADAAGAKDGVSLDVPDLGKVDIRINAGMFLNPKIFLTVNGHVVKPNRKPPSSADISNHEKWKKSVQTGSYVLFFVSAISGLGGIIAILFEVDILLEMGMGGFTICAGLIFLALGYVAQDISWGGFAALVVALLLYVADAMLVVAMKSGGNMFIRVFLRSCFYKQFMQAGSYSLLLQKR